MDKRTKMLLIGVAIVGVVAAAIWFGPSLMSMISGDEEEVAAPGPTPAEKAAAALQARAKAADARAEEAERKAAAALRAKREAEEKSQAAQTATVTPVVASGCDFSGWKEYCDGMAKTQQVAGLYPFVVVRSANPFSSSVRVVALCHDGKNVELPASNFTSSRNGRIVVRNFKLPDENKTVVASYRIPAYGWGEKAHLAFQKIADGTYSHSDLAFVNVSGQCESVSSSELKLAIGRVPEHGGGSSTGTTRVSAPAKVAATPSRSETRFAVLEEQVAKNTGDIYLLGVRVTSLQGEFNAWAQRDTCGPDCDVRRQMQRNVGRDGFMSP